jgi:hypothetical protein
MHVMDDIALEQETPHQPGPPKRRHWWRWVLLTLAVLGLVGAGVVWWATRPPAPVSVSDVVDRFRTEQPSGTASGAGPARGVYVYATTGWERVSTGNITHHYPKRTTLSVTDHSCGLRIRWDALAGRWAQWDLCRTDSGWRLQHYIDVHKFLHVQDVHDYTCSGYPVIVCRTESGVLTATVETLSAGHVRITQAATGKSVNNGVIEAWISPIGLPQRVVVENHGAQTVLGSRVSYSESAEFTLTSTTPLR